MKERLLKEIFWFFIAVMAAFPLAFLFLGFLELTSAQSSVNQIEKVLTLQLYIVGYILSFFVVYFVRLLVAGLKVVILK